MQIYPINNYEEYRSSRNIYAEKYKALPQQKAPTAFTCAATEMHRGKWRDFFQAPSDAKLHLEIGCYHGDSLLAMAEANPKEYFIGIEWKFREAYKAAEKAIRRKLPNLCILRANVARVPWVFSPGELDRIWILFPDPWPKTTHQKWRVLHADFFRSLALLLDAEKELLIKTDDLDYSRFIRTELDIANAFSALPEEKAQSLWESYPPTPFEKIFFRNNSPIFQFALFRNSNFVLPPAPVEKVFHGTI